MLIKRMIHRYLDEAGGAGGAGGSGGTDGGAAGTGGAVGAQGDAAGAGTAGSLLADGADSATDFIPEKYRVTKDDGSFDMDASSRKLADAYTSLEKRFGSGEAAPKDVGEYKITVPETLQGFDPAADEGVQNFLKDAHAAGLNQAQLDLVMGKYFEIAPQLAQGAHHLDAAAARAELEKTWTNEADFKKNVRHAYLGASAAAAKAGIDINEIMSGPLSNNPQFMRLMAALGPEFAEDSPPAAATMVSQDDINKLIVSEAYTNPNHVEHATVSAKVKAHFEKKYGKEAVA